MRSRRRPATWPRYLAITVLIAALWAVAVVPTGFGIFQLSMFAAPGMVLAVATSWMAHALSPEKWDWDYAFGAAVIGATAFPPFVAVFVAWSATLDANTMGTLFVLGSWLALVGGFIGGGIRTLIRRRRVRPRPPVAHVELLD